MTQPQHSSDELDILFAELITTHNEALRAGDDVMAKANIRKAKVELQALLRQKELEARIDQATIAIYAADKGSATEKRLLTQLAQLNKERESK